MMLLLVVVVVVVVVVMTLMLTGRKHWRRWMRTAGCIPETLLGADAALLKDFNPFCEIGIYLCMFYLASRFQEILVYS